MNKTPGRDPQEPTIVQTKTIDLSLVRRKKEPPKISLRKALEIAEAYIEKEKIYVSEYYLREARQVYSEKGAEEPLWWFWWVKTNMVLGDYVEIVVSMNGKARRQPLM